MADDRPPGGDGGSRRAAWAGLVASIVALLVGLVVLLAPTGWRTVQTANVLPSGAVAILDQPGVRICAGMDEIPSEAGYAEFIVQGADVVTGRLVVAGAERSWVSPVQRVPVREGLVRFAMPAGARLSTTAAVCLDSTKGSDPPAQVLGTGELAAVRLVGHAPQSRLAQLPAMLGRVGTGAGAPLNLLGGWAFVVLAVVVFGGALAVVVRAWTRGTRPGRRTWLALAAIGVLHAWVWAAAMPPFQVPDENSHFHYATFVADHQKLPRDVLADLPAASESQLLAERHLLAMQITFRPTMRPPWAASAEEALHRALEGASLSVPDTHTNATGQPPFYYVSVAPAALGGGTALDQLARMRMLSGLWMAVAVLGAIALVRGLSPARPRWAVTAGLVVALFPLLAFMAGGVNPDVAMTALVFWVFAAAVRCWRGGVTRANAALFGAAVALLLLTKLTALAIVPGALVLVTAAVVRDVRRGEGATVLRALALGVAVAALPIVAYIGLSVASDRPIVPRVIGAVATETVHGAPPADAGGQARGSVLNAVWQLFLPRLPGQADVFPGTPLWNIWAQGLAGRFGYLDYAFTEGTRRVIVFGWIAVVVAALAGALAVVRSGGWRRARRRFGPVLLAGGISVALLLVVIGVIDRNSRLTDGPPFQQARYLLPGFPIALVAVPLALRAFGRRTQPFVGVLMVGAMVLWAVGAFGLTLVRYWG